MSCVAQIKFDDSYNEPGSQTCFVFRRISDDESINILHLIQGGRSFNLCVTYIAKLKLRKSKLINETVLSDPVMMLRGVHN